ncbi:MAG: hypothetical protein DMG01_15600 [Acidobacteria bacterium]|nr:MAG: hypothetical protein DMG01_15600 [Acidobacteriota bacterium]
MDPARLDYSTTCIRIEEVARIQKALGRLSSALSIRTCGSDRVVRCIIISPHAHSDRGRRPDAHAVGSGGLRRRRQALSGLRFRQPRPRCGVGHRHRRQVGARRRDGVSRPRDEIGAERRHRLSILELRDEGKLSLDDSAEKYVPELASLKYPTTDSPKITVRHLLSHSEGFPEDNPWGDQQLSIGDDQLSQMLRGGIPFSNAPGVAYEYSNYGFMILGRIVGRVSGVPYADYVAANILRPLGMMSTTLEPSSVPADRLAHGYRREDNQWKEER